MATDFVDKLKIISVFHNNIKVCKNCILSSKKNVFEKKIILICCLRWKRVVRCSPPGCTGSSRTVRNSKTGSGGASIGTGFGIGIWFDSVWIGASIGCRVCCWCSRRSRGRRWGRSSCRREGRGLASASRFRWENTCRLKRWKSWFETTRIMFKLKSIPLI